MNKFITELSKFIESHHGFIFWLILSALLILRIPLEGWLMSFVPSTKEWVEPLYEIGTYLLITLLIWVEWDNLHIHNIDPLAIFLIIIFKPLSTILLTFINPSQQLTFPKDLSLPFFAISLFLIFLTLKKKRNLKHALIKSIWWFILGGLFGISFYVLEGIGMIKFLDFPFPPNPGLTSLIYPLYQLGYAAVPEEPVFRGFLWGGLRRAGVKDFWILLIQAFLFALGHIGLLSIERGGLFLALGFLTAILMGILVWRSRRLSSSIAFHGIANGSHIFQFWIYSFLLK